MSMSIKYEVKFKNPREYDDIEWDCIKGDIRDLFEDFRIEKDEQFESRQWYTLTGSALQEFAEFAGEYIEPRVYQVSACDERYYVGEYDHEKTSYHLYELFGCYSKYSNILTPLYPFDESHLPAMEQEAEAITRGELLFGVPLDEIEYLKFYLFW